VFRSVCVVVNWLNRLSGSISLNGALIFRYSVESDGTVGVDDVPTRNSSDPAAETMTARTISERTRTMPRRADTGDS
jgi:hypothetical protein